ncbi:MAG: ribbon-helix-helix domain-containing protein [Acidobacteriota bacterium]
MHRTQVLLHKDQYHALKTQARREGKSLSELIRRAVAEWLGETRTTSPARLADICALGKDPKGPKARDHDSFLYKWNRK